MKTISLFLVTGLLATGLAASAYGADQPKSNMPDVANATGGAASGSMMGEHAMSGTVKKINHKSGVVKLQAKPHDLELHFPPDSIKDLKKGDKITVHLSFQKQ